MRKGRWLKAIVVIGLWTAYGTFSAFETYYRGPLQGKPNTWTGALFAELSYAYIWAAFTPLILWLAQRYRIMGRPRPWRNLVIHLGATALLAVATKLLWDVINMPVDGYFRSGFMLLKLIWSIDSNFDVGTLLYWLVLLMHYSIEYYRRYQDGLVDAARLQTSLVQAQLQALKMQLHPHFLFNALHTISALVHEDPEAAETMISQLSELLRLSLENSVAQEIPLGEELNFLELYLGIERTRFEERLTVEYAIEPETRDALVPNLVLQPLVENAIRHGIAHRPAGGRIEISARRQYGNLILVITDNGAGFSRGRITPLDEGVGLASTRGRLERLYGPAQSLVLKNRGTGGVEARILMPFVTEKMKENTETNGTN